MLVLVELDGDTLLADADADDDAYLLGEEVLLLVPVILILDSLSVADELDVDRGVGVGVFERTGVVPLIVLYGYVYSLYCISFFSCVDRDNVSDERETDDCRGNGDVDGVVVVVAAVFTSIDK